MATADTRVYGEPSDPCPSRRVALRRYGDYADSFVLTPEGVSLTATWERLVKVQMSILKPVVWVFAGEQGGRLFRRAIDTRFGMWKREMAGLPGGATGRPEDLPEGRAHFSVSELLEEAMQAVPSQVLDSPPGAPPVRLPECPGGDGGGGGGDDSPEEEGEAVEAGGGSSRRAVHDAELTLHAACTLLSPTSTSTVPFPAPPADSRLPSGQQPAADGQLQQARTHRRAPGPGPESSDPRPKPAPNPPAPAKGRLAAGIAVALLVWQLISIAKGRIAAGSRSSLRPGPGPVPGPGLI